MHLSATHARLGGDGCDGLAGKLEYHQCGIADTESADVTSAGASALRYMTEAFNRSPSTCVVVHCASGVTPGPTEMVSMKAKEEGKKVVHHL